MARETRRAASRRTDKISSPPGRPHSAREKLLAAAYQIMSRRGLDESTIAEIIEEAGVGVGSFYNHFTSKEELAQAVFSSRADAYGAALELVVRQAPNAATATCYAYRRLIEEAERDKVWASFIVQLEPKLQMLDRLLRKYARVGLQIGIDTGVFKIDNLEAAITAIHAMQIAMVKAMIEGSLSHREAHRSAVFTLRMYGVDDTEASRLANLSMSALRREMKPSKRKNGDD